MPIEIACPQCQCVLKAPDGMGGKKARCKRCQHSFRIPGGKADAGADSTGDPENLSVVSESPFTFEPTAPPPPAKPIAKKPAAQANVTPEENPFAAVTAAASIQPDDATPLPKSLAKSKGKTDESKQNPRSSSYRNKAAPPATKSRTPVLLLAALLCAGGGAGGFYAFTEYQKSKAPQPAAQAPIVEPVANPEPNKASEKAKDVKSDTTPAPGAPVAKAAVRPNRAGPKVSGGMKLPAFAEKPKPHEKAVASIALDHDVKAVKQVIVGGAEGPVVLVVRRTFDGLGGKGIKDTVDRYALNTLRRIDQTEVPADAVRAYPRIGDVSPGGDRYAYEHPVGKLSVTQLGTKTILVDGLDLGEKTDGKDAAKHPGIAAITFLTDEKIAIVTKAGVVESWDLTAKKKVGASEPIPGATNLVEKRSLAFHRDRIPEKSLFFAFAGGAIYSVAPGGKPQTALAIPHGATECLALAVDGGANRLAVAYRATEPGEHVRFIHARIGDPKPGADEALDAEVGVPVLAEWTRPETFGVITDKGLGLAYDADTNQLIAGFRTPAPTIVVADGSKHWCLLPDTADAKKSVLVNVTVPPEDYSPSLTGEKWKPFSMTITPAGTAK